MTITITIAGNADYCSENDISLDSQLGMSDNVFQIEMSDNVFMCIMYRYGLPEIKKGNIYATKLFSAMRECVGWNRYEIALETFKISWVKFNHYANRLNNIIDLAMRREEEIVWDWALDWSET